MGNSPSQVQIDRSDDNTLLEVVDVDENEKLKNEYNRLRENFEMLNNELYSQKLEVKNLNNELDNSKNENIKLVEELKSVNYLNDVLEIKTKSQINENNKLKERYDNLEYVKLDIEEKYLNLLDNTDSVEYLKQENIRLEEDLKKQIIKYNDEKNMNRIVGDSLNDMTKQYTKYKQLYTQNCIESNTLKSSVHQYKKEYDIILKKKEKLLDTISASLKNKLFKKQLYECIENICEIEPFVYNDIIDKIIKIVINKIIIEKNKID